MSKLLVLACFSCICYYGSGLKVIGAGMSRTGTNTLKKALEILLQAEVYHADVWLGKLDHIDRWKDYFAARIENKKIDFNWNEMYGSYEAATDQPTALLWKELMEEYPNAKVILTIRDEESWFQSYCNSCNKSKILAKSDQTFYNRMGEATMRFHAFWMNSIEPSYFEPFMGDNDMCHYKDMFMTRYKKHNEEVIQGVPKEKLLVMNIADGQNNSWEELCTFLNLPIPSVPFPHTNKGDANIMLETSKAKISLKRDDEEIYIPPPHGKYLWCFLIFGILCVFIYALQANRAEVAAENREPSRAEIAAELQSRKLENRIPFSGKGNKEN
jgi:hypothetical protein